MQTACPPRPCNATDLHVNATGKAVLLHQAFVLAKGQGVQRVRLCSRQQAGGSIIGKLSSGSGRGWGKRLMLAAQAGAAVLQTTARNSARLLVA